ncbi:hypothetical protein FNT36_23925 [Hymenobacter setariae]|uniref:Uncharacterized protein n=1 Tax=Hymenobacter setariae TaxID=2594794 RepID=A0A558BK75_9BACT|nr:hypothetical protein FNT36_23925 [Hymenobacter setariae]
MPLCATVNTCANCAGPATGPRCSSGQQRTLLTLELESLVALTLHTIPEILTVSIEREVGT